MFNVQGALGEREVEMNGAVATGLRTYGGTLAHAGGRGVRASALHDGDALAVVMYASPPYDVSVPPLDVARLAINLSPASVQGGLDGEPARTYAARRHSLFLTPAGASAAWRKTASSRHIGIYFRADAFAQPEDAAWGPLLSSGVPVLNASLAGAGALFEMLAAELSEAQQPFSAEAVDSLARLILVRLARCKPQGVVRANPLTPALQARIGDYVNERLDQRLLVPELAAVVGLSPNRFAQAFAGATGQSPHQFVMRQRVQRAVQLLQQSSHSLAEVAAASGFASQQHLTQVMRRRVGVTPGRQRALAATADPRAEEPAGSC